VQPSQQAAKEKPGVLNDGFDILYGHFQYDPIEVQSVMKGKPLVVGVLRDPFALGNSAFNWQKRKQSATSAEHFFQNISDHWTARLIGHMDRSNIPHVNVLDPHCQRAMANLKTFGFVGMSSDYTSFLSLLLLTLPRPWNVSSRELCMPVENKITTGKGGMKISAETLSPETVAKFESNFNCLHRVVNQVKSDWDIVKHLPLYVRNKLEHETKLLKDCQENVV
jgi:hypothetical protein